MMMRACDNHDDGIGRTAEIYGFDVHVRADEPIMPANLNDRRASKPPCAYDCISVRAGVMGDFLPRSFMFRWAPPSVFPSTLVPIDIQP